MFVKKWTTRKVFFCPVWMCLYLFGLIFSQIWESQKSHLCLFKLILFLNYENSFKISVLLIVIFFVFSLNLLPTTENHDWCAKIKRCTTNWEVEKLNTKNEERATIDHLVVLMPGSIFSTKFYWEMTNGIPENVPKSVKKGQKTGKNQSSLD